MTQSKQRDHSALRMIWLSILVVILDQWVKHLVVSHLFLYQKIVLLPFLNVTLVFNHGAAFSFLNNQSGWQRWLFVVLAIVVSILVLIWLHRSSPERKMQNIGLALILGGALGNLWDRLSLSFVIDFVDFHLSNWHFATFNLADAAISIGVFLIVVNLFWQTKT